MKDEDLKKEQAEAVIEEEKKKNEPIQYELDDDEKNKIARTICWKAEQWEDARSDWMGQVTEARNLYEGDTGHIHPPWDDASVISTMITTWVVDMLVAKLMPLVWNDRLMYWKGREVTDTKRVDDLRTFMRWAVTSELDLGNLVEQILQDLVIDGTFAVKISWEVVYKWVQRRYNSGLIEKMVGGFKKIFKKYEAKYEYKKFEHPLLERLPIEDVLFPWDSKTSSDWYEKIHRVYYTYNDLLEMAERGIILEDAVDESLIAKEDEKAKNLKGPEKAKMDSEGMAFHERRREQNPIECLEGEIKYKVDGRLTKSIFLVAKTNKRYLSGKPLSKVSRIEESPIFVFSLIERSGRLLGKSMAQVVAPLHKEMDAIHNQRVHAGTIALAPPGFYRPASGFKPKKTKIGPGYMTPVDDPSKDIAFPNFSAQLLQVSFQEEASVMGLIERLTSISSYVLGKESEIVKSRATATGTLALIGQAEQRFNRMARRVQDAIATVLEKILNQYQQFMPPGLDKRILGEDGERLFPQGLAPEDIAGEFDCYLELDFASANKNLEKQTAVMMYQQMAQEPLINRDPALRWELAAEYIKAMGKKDVERFLGKKPPSMEAYNADADEEFTEMMSGRQVNVKENENAMQHLIAHLAQKNSDRYMLMPDEYKPMLDQHMYQTQLLIVKQLREQAQQAEQAQKEEGRKYYGEMQQQTPRQGGGGYGGQYSPSQQKTASREPASAIGTPGMGGGSTADQGGMGS